MHAHAAALPPVYELAAFSVYRVLPRPRAVAAEALLHVRGGRRTARDEVWHRTLISVEAAQAWRRARERMAAVSRRRDAAVTAFADFARKIASTIDGPHTRADTERGVTDLHGALTRGGKGCLGSPQPAIPQ